MIRQSMPSDLIRGCERFGDKIMRSYGVRLERRRLNSVRHNLCHAEQNDQGEKQQIDIGHDLSAAAKFRDLGDDHLARDRFARAPCYQTRKTTRFIFEPFDALKEIKRTQRRHCAHAGKDQDERGNHGPLLIFFHEIQAEIDYRQKDEVREETKGVAQVFHKSAPINQAPHIRQRRYRLFDQSPVADGSSESSCSKPARLARPYGAIVVVRSEGLEPPRFYSLPPQGSASTNSATSA